MIKPSFVFEVTPRCNNRCVYCYNVWEDNTQYPTGELSLLQIKHLFEKIFKEVTPNNVVLAGGEPLLRPDILEICSFFKAKGVKLAVATNGVLLDDAMTKKLADNGVTYVEISLPTINALRYQSLCGVDALKNVRKAILNVKKYGIRMSAAMVITKQNLADFNDVADLAFAFSADYLALNRFVPTGRGLTHQQNLMPSLEELKTVLTSANKKSEETGFQINVTVPVEDCLIAQSQFPCLKFTACQCGWAKWVIDPLGNLRTCEQNKDILGNLFEKRFEDLALSIPAKEFRNKNKKSECSSCGRYANCGGGCRFLKI